MPTPETLLWAAAAGWALALLLVGLAVALILQLRQVREFSKLADARHLAELERLGRMAMSGRPDLQAAEVFGGRADPEEEAMIRVQEMEIEALQRHLGAEAQREGKVFTDEELRREAGELYHRLHSA